jgi:hypothetical protein
MSKKISPKRFIYDNGHLILKNNENDSRKIDLNKNVESLIEDDSRKNNKIYKLEYPKLNQSNNINNNYNIFRTQLNGDTSDESQKKEIEKNVSYNNNNEYEISDNYNKEEKIEDNDYNSEYINYKSIENNPSSLRAVNLKSLHKMKLSKISKDITKMCNYLYTSPRKNDSNIKYKMFQKEREYVKQLTKKNYLIDEDLVNKQSYRNKIKKRKCGQSNQNIFNQNKSRNILSDDDIINDYYNKNKEVLKTIDNDKLTSYKFENLYRNVQRYKHPQLYKLKNIVKKAEENDIKLPPIKTGSQSPIELTESIPMKKGITKGEQRKEYFYYKVMRLNRLEGFHI